MGDQQTTSEALRALEPTWVRAEMRADTATLEAISTEDFTLVETPIQDIAMQHASTNPPPLRQFSPTVPSNVEQIVMKTLEKEPKDRFQSAAEMQKALRQCARELARSRQSSRPSPNVPSQSASPGIDGQTKIPPINRGQPSP